MKSSQGDVVQEGWSPSNSSCHGCVSRVWRNQLPGKDFISRLTQPWHELLLPNLEPCPQGWVSRVGTGAGVGACGGLVVALIVVSATWFQADDRMVACFGNEDPGPHALHLLEDNKIEIIRPGENLPGAAG
jgi:hypothetical protein